MTTLSISVEAAGNLPEFPFSTTTLVLTVDPNLVSEFKRSLKEWSATLDSANAAKPLRLTANALFFREIELLQTKEGAGTGDVTGSPPPSPRKDEN